MKPPLGQVGCKAGPGGGAASFHRSIRQRDYEELARVERRHEQTVSETVDTDFAGARGIAARCRRHYITLYDSKSCRQPSCDGVITPDINVDLPRLAYSFPSGSRASRKLACGATVHANLDD